MLRCLCLYRHTLKNPLLNCWWLRFYMATDAHQRCLSCRWVIECEVEVPVIHQQVYEWCILNFWAIVITNGGRTSQNVSTRAWICETGRALTINIWTVSEGQWLLRLRVLSKGNTDDICSFPPISEFSIPLSFSFFRPFVHAMKVVDSSSSFGWAGCSSSELDILMTSWEVVFTILVTRGAL